ncbi:zinc finger protein 384 isoform X4 [Patella vulgata]|uniref:zinc finger protein 384 isoform X4 n=1 Tax=Patella vulgata TaxID=6465 RepID=UPI00217F8575|nr:zinc finger protein 384 isoform X4 [Patella vulgata]
MYMLPVSQRHVLHSDCYAGINMTERHHPREDFSLWSAAQGSEGVMSATGPNSNAAFYFSDYFKWKNGNHLSADIFSLGGMGQDSMNHHVHDIHRVNSVGVESYGRTNSTGSLSSPSTPTHPAPNIPLVVPHPVKPNRTGKTYQCKMCDQIFNTKSDMLIHSQQIHKQDPKPYKCPTCSKCFANSSYLSQHGRIHSGIKPYKCEICERKFTQLSHLQQHIRTHTGEKPYKCMHPGCGKAFSQLSNLQSHSRSHMTDKPYRCNSCYKCYADEQSLREHIPKHSETKHLKTSICHICGKSYTQETYLVRHMAKHSQDNAKKPMLRPIKQEPYDPLEKDFGRLPLPDKFQDISACSKGFTSAFMPLPQLPPSSTSTGSYPYGANIGANSLSSPLPHISSMTTPRYFPYDPIGFRKNDASDRNLNVPMTNRDSMIANSLLSLQHIKNYASQQMPSFSTACSGGSRFT